MTQESDTTVHGELLRLVTACWASKAVCLAARLGIADRLRDGPRPAAELAAATGMHADALYRLLRALASLGVFEEVDAHAFRLTPLAQYLRTDVPDSLHALAVLLGEPEHWRSWEGLIHSVRTGRPAFDAAFGMPFFGYLGAHPEAARRFDDAMASRSAGENAAILAAYDFSTARVVVDVGGGTGTLVRALLAANPRLRGVVFDQPHVIDAARSGIPLAAAVANRHELVAGDFFSALPVDGDVYVLKRVVHDWDDKRAHRILSTCRDAMRDDARLLLIEAVVPAGNGPSFGKLLDLLMLVWHEGGRGRTEGELTELLGAARLRLARVIPTRAGVSIVEALPV